MTDDLYTHLSARLQALELMVGSQHSPLPEVSKADVKRLQAELASLKDTIGSTQRDVISRTAGLATADGVKQSFGRLLPEVIVPLVGDALLAEKQAREKQIRQTLADINSELVSVRNAAAAQAQHSADFLRASAAHFARG